MIDYKELRLGNWVIMSQRNDRVKCDAKPMQLTNVSKEGYNLQHPVSLLMYGWDWFEPIHLTPEILDRCGFEYREVKGEKRFVLGDIEIEQQGDNMFAVVIWDSSAPFLTHYIGHHQYLHQLQNLYHALTGEELTYTP